MSLADPTEPWASIRWSRVHELDVIDHDAVVTVLNRRVRSWIGPPYDLLCLQRQTADVDLPVIGVHDHGASGRQLTNPLLGDRVEIELGLRVGRVRDQLVDLLSRDLQERRARLRVDGRVSQRELRHRRIESAVEVERAVLAVPDVAAVERSLGLEFAPVARDGPVHDRRAPEFLAETDDSR